MKILTNTKSVRTRILAAFLVVALVSLVVGVVGITRAAGIYERTDYIYSQNLLPLESLGAAESQFYNMRVQVLNTAVSVDEAAAAKNEADFDAAVTAVEEHLREYRRSDLTGREDALARVEAGFERYLTAARTEGLPLARSNDAAGFRRVRDTVLAPAFLDASEAMRELLEIEKTSAGESYAVAGETYSSARTMLLVLALGALGLAVGLGVAIAGLIARPLAHTADVLDRVADGDLTRTLDVTGRDEVARVATAVNRMVERMATAIRSISEAATALAGSSEELSAVSEQLSSNAEEAAAQATMVSASSEQVSANVQTVASGTEQMGASIGEIAANATQAAQVAVEASHVAEATNVTVTKLSESSARIDEVARVITSIAEQTNLLALNATIEAARAGEAGKGFAVVANEVKELAKETGKATDDISHTIAALQNDAGATTSAIAEITTVIGQINSYQGTIASAVEEQTATTSEISRSVSEAATGTSDIAGNISGVARAAEDTAQGAANIRGAASDLAHQADQLTALVGQFRVSQ